MTKLTIFNASDLTPVTQAAISALDQIKEIVAAVGAKFAHLPTDIAPDLRRDDELIARYAPEASRAAGIGAYLGADVIRLSPGDIDASALRTRFLREHTHEDDEVRFFVAGSGAFFIHADGKIIAVECERGDLLFVPAGAPHWFDAGEAPDFVAIRLFTATNAWAADYTGSGIAERFHAEEVRA
jgi:1,2-dihydroxy-3-keto-5-methylthiopentene dioxygenase